MRATDIALCVIALPGTLNPVMAGGNFPTCFTTGHKMQKDDIETWAEKACKQFDNGKKGPFNRNFPAGHKEVACYNVGKDRVQLEVINRGSARTMDPGWCWSIYANMIRWCDAGFDGHMSSKSTRGGRNDYDNYHFRFDPNKGNC